MSLRNRYMKSPVSVLEGDSKAGNPIHGKELADYLAASAPTHCCDGWAFLGRAVASHLRGDPDTARHLVYYAELRAAMAMLATEGIGYFSRLHFSIDKQQKASIGARTGTHVATWAILEEWAFRNQAADLLGGSLPPETFQ